MTTKHKEMHPSPPLLTCQAATRAEQLAILTALLASGHYSIRCEYDGDDFLGGTFRLQGETLAITQALAIHREFNSLASPAAATSPAIQAPEDY